MDKEISKRFSKGIPASPGIIIGKACVFQDILYLVERRSVEEGRAEQEVVRLKQAIRKVIDELMEDSFLLSKRLEKREAEIFLAHIAILEDPYFVSKMFKEIREGGVNAEAAVLKQVDEFGRNFEQMEDPYFRERGTDIRDIGRRVIQKLMSSQQFSCDSGEPVIIVARELTPSDTIRIDKEKVLAFATESGGKESHAAILARSMGIPAVLGLDGLLSKVTKGDTLIVDGDTGLVMINPPEEVIQNCQNLQKTRESYEQSSENYSFAV